MTPIQLASNENPHGASPRAVEAATRALADGHRYPDASAARLRLALAERHEVSPEEVALGAGSSELIDHLIAVSCRPGAGDEIVTHRHSFIGYRMLGAARNVTVVEAETRKDLCCDIDALCAAMGPRTRIVFLASPNNPTGAQVTRVELERLLAAAPPKALVVIDEAYHEYAAALDADYPRSEPYRRDRPGLVTLRTFSKVHGLAGLRVGYAIADRDVVASIDRVRRPYDLSHVAQAAAQAALGDGDHVARSVAANSQGLALFARAFGDLGLLALPSRGNFVLVDAGTAAGDLDQRLRARAIHVRPMAGWGLPNHLRVTVGTEPEIRALFDALGEAGPKRR